MILAAGRGVRMGELTAAQPKPLLEVGGVSLIERHVERLAAGGVREIVINLSYRGAQIRERLRDGRRWGVRIDYSEEGEPPLEAGGGIVKALPLLTPGPFLVVNSDVLTDFDFVLLKDTFANTLVLVANPAHHPGGDFGLDPDGRVSAAPPLLTYAGIAVFAPALFASLAPGRRPLKPVLDAALERGELYGRYYEGLWLDVGTPERLEAAQATVLK